MSGDMDSKTKMTKSRHISAGLNYLQLECLLEAYIEAPGLEGRPLPFLIEELQFGFKETRLSMSFLQGMCH